MRRTLARLYCVIWLALAGMSNLSAIGGDRLSFRHLNANDGLSQNLIRAIVQDKQGFIWIGTKSGLNRYDGNEVKVFRHDPADPSSLGSNYISSLFVDDDNHLWIGTEKGVWQYYPEYERFEHLSGKSFTGRSISGDVMCIKKDDTGKIWFAEIRGALFCYDPRTKELESYPYSDLYPEPLTIRCLETDSKGNVWLGDFGHGLLKLSRDRKILIRCNEPEDASGYTYVTAMTRWKADTMVVGLWGGGVSLFDMDKMRSEPLFTTDEFGERVFCRVVCMRDDGILLAGGETGLFVYDMTSRRMLYHTTVSDQDKHSLSDRAVHALCSDSNGGLWVGTYFGGVDYSNKIVSPFKKYYPDGSEQSMHGRRVRCFSDDGDGNIWIGTEDGGINIFDPARGVFEFYAPSRDFVNTHDMCRIGDTLWVAAYTDGVVAIDIRHRKVIRRYSRDDLGGSIRDNSVFNVSSGRDGTVYIGTYLGLHRYDPSNDTFVKVPGVPAIFVSFVLEDSEGNLWVGTSQGLFVRMSRSGEWEHYINDPEDGSSLCYNRIKSIMEDAGGNIWIGTSDGGFCRFYPESGTFETFNRSNGLPSDTIFQMEEDSNGVMWLSTDNGLVSFDKENSLFRSFFISDGLASNQFNDMASFKDEDGTLYFGGIEGFISFDPDEIRKNEYVPSAVFSDLSINGQAVKTGEDGAPLDKSISYIDKMVLGYAQNTLSFKVSTFDFNRQSPDCSIMYMMDGTNEGWQPLDKSQMVRFVQLRPGHYRFVVKAVMPGVPDRELRSLRITVRPPWYGSVPAFLAYLAMFAGALYAVLRSIKKRNEEEYLKKVRILEAESEKEVFESKIRFFTNVAHEIRTPMTLINGPLDNIIKKGGFDEETREDLRLMKNNSSKLLRLINQLLDFRKVESSGYVPSFSRTNVSALLREFVKDFQYPVKDRGLSLDINLPEEDIMADVNPEALSNIISNLLSNGVKYADTKLNVSLSRSGENLVLKTGNDGAIIPPDMREAIFKPFVRYSVSREKVIPGTGIGLVYSRTLAEAHGGTLLMEDDDKSNIFRLELPLVHEIEGDDRDVETAGPDSALEPREERNGRNTILLVEDQADLLGFERRELSKTWRVLTAADGLEALSLLEKESVDIVVSDVMMPGMDGYTLCKTIKSDIRLSHIPVVLLTAKTDDKSKIKGLELGADSYVEKPFSMDVLKAGISSLLLNRENIRNAFASSPFIPASSVAVTYTDKKFIEEIYGIISQNYANTEFRMDDIAASMNMSRTSFYRKIHGVLDMTPNDLLRLERLKQAASLLRSGGYRINEVCYMTGFSSPSYFAKCFQKQFGVSPMDFMAKSKQDATGSGRI